MFHPLETMNVMAGPPIAGRKFQSAIVAEITEAAIITSLHIVVSGGYSKTN